MAKNDGGPAFPGYQPQNPNGTWNDTVEYGMSLRDYFAAVALQGWISTYPDISRHPCDTSQGDKDFGPGIAELSYKMADHMLAERDK